MAFHDHQQDYINFDLDTQDNFVDFQREYQAQTPKNLNEYFPLTPDTTPFSNRHNVQQAGFSRTAESSPTRREPQLTIKASHAMQRGGSCQDNFAAMRQQPISPIPSPPHTAPLKARGSVDYAAFPPPSFLNMSELNLNVSADGKTLQLTTRGQNADIVKAGGGCSSLDCSPMTKASSATSSFQTSPEMGHMSLFGKMDAVDSDTMASRLLTLAEPLNDAGPSADSINNDSPIQGNDPFLSDDGVNAMFPSPSTPANHVRYRSFDSGYGNNSTLNNGPLFFNAINSAASSPSKGHGRSRSQAISEADSIEEVVENTGVSIDEINSFIGGPNENNRWICLFEGCEKHKAGETFGRKENIKSHVQGHLQDRQYRCKLCKKTFVRQHDLKRHANIHTLKVVKKCACGKEFARADALTRHRQRGMCSGAFPNTPQKIAKRGRPKKVSRPDTEDRAEKAAKTRERVMERMASASVSGSSAHTSPAMQALPMSRQESNASSQSFYSTPPELDLSSSSPAQPKSLDLHAGFPANPSPQTSEFFNNAFFEKDFVLSAFTPSDQFGSLQAWSFDNEFESTPAEPKTPAQLNTEGVANSYAMEDVMGTNGDLLNDF